MSFTASTQASVAIQNGMTFSAALQVTETGLVMVQETFAAAVGTDTAVNIGIQDVTKLHYLMISFSGSAGQFKVNSGTTIVPMESGGSIQFVGETTTPATPAGIFLNALSDGGTVGKLLKILVQTASANCTVQVVALYTA